MDDIYISLANLEKEHNILILYAVECGSRAWGFNYEDSDFDIRFVYIKNNKHDYMTILQSLETIVYFSDDKKYDYQGWDIIKATKHLQESNPSLLEWLYSPIVYINKSDFQNKFLLISQQMHTQTSLIFHYYNMARKNWNTWIANQEKIICKKYFHVIRPLATLQYLLDREKDDTCNLIINFDKLLDIIKTSISSEVYDEIKKMIHMKRTMTAEDFCEPNVCINDWTQSQFERVDALSRKSDAPTIDFKAQSLITIYKKLENEYKKVVAITNCHGFTDRNNYLSVIGFALQLLWLIEHPDKETRSLPAKIHQLLSTVTTVSESVKSEITKIIIEKQEIEKKISSDINLEYINEIFIDPIIKFIKKYDGVDDIDKLSCVSPIVKSSLKTFKLKPSRDDIVEYMFKHMLDILWLMGNTDDRPTNVINIGDPTNAISEKFIDYVKTTVLEFRPKYIIAKNDVLHVWINEILHEQKEVVLKMQYNLAHIREINTEKRFKKSLKTLSPNVFNELIKSF